MPANAAIDVTRRFHAATAHSPYSVRTSGHMLDWDVKPFPFKVYTDLPALPLPREIGVLPTPTLAALEAGEPALVPLTLERLTAVLYYSAGVTKKKSYPGGGEVLFRAAASTGALYQTEVYVVAGEAEGLEPGLYHFCPGDFTLRRLRAGDVRSALAAAAADETLAARAATLVLSAIYWRNTWKYQARGYRHLFWDSGTMLANALAVATAEGLAPRLLAGFVDGEVNHLLGLAPEREAALELLALGPEGAPAPPAGALPPIAHPFMPLSSSEVDYPLLREIHAASMLDTPADVTAWRAAGQERGVGSGSPLESVASKRRAPDSVETGREHREQSDSRGDPDPTPPLVILPRDQDGGRPLGETIQRRGSTRAFGHDPLSAVELGTALWAATRPLEADFPAGLVDLYLVVNAVEGVAPGSYYYRGKEGALEPLAAGDFRDRSSYLCLEQALGGDAAAVIYFLAPLDAILARFGNRGYRLANLEAGLAGGRAYLAAYALGFGASGLTFYDDHVVEFFSPHAAGKDAVFVTALGRAHRGTSDTIERIQIKPKEASA